MGYARASSEKLEAISVGFHAIIQRSGESLAFVPAVCLLVLLLLYVPGFEEPDLTSNR